MNIVGQFAETVFVTVKELYRGLNPATLTGGIDVIVVRQPDGSFQCSPFHVRFGKLGVLRSKEKIVDIEINGEPVDLHMKLGDNGEAFFVEQNESMEVPAHLCTSPIPQEVPEELEETPEGPTFAGSGARRKKRRRKRVRSDSHLRGGASSSSEERDREKEADPAQWDSTTSEDMSTPLQLSKSVYYSMSEETNGEPGPLQTREQHPHSDGEQSSTENSVFYSRPDSPKSDSELLLKSQDSSGPQMQWNWGGFPQVRLPEKTPAESPVVPPSGVSHFRTIERQNSFDLGCEVVVGCGRAGSVTVVKPQPRTLDNCSMQTSSFTWEKKPHGDLFMSCVSSGDVDLQETVEYSLGQEKKGDLSSSLGSGGPNPHFCKEGTVSAEHVCSVTGAICPQPENGVDTETKAKDTEKQIVTENKDCTALRTSQRGGELLNLQSQGVLSEQSDQGCTNGAPIRGGDGGTDPWAEGGDEGGAAGGTDGSSSEKTAAWAEGKDVAVNLAKSSEASSKLEQDKKKGKRNHHLGPTDIYLDDLTSLDPEVAALYFPKIEAEGAFHSVADLGSGSGSHSPQSVGSAAMDSGTEYLSDSTCYNMDVSISLCGKEGDTRQITKEKFTEHLVTYQDFINNPGIIEDPSLVFCINSNYYNWAVAAPMILSMSAFQKNLPKVFYSFKNMENKASSNNLHYKLKKKQAFSLFSVCHTKGTVERLVKDKMSKKSGRWWFSWRRRDMDNNQQKHSREEQEEPLTTASSTVQATLDDVDSDEAAGLGRKAIIPHSLSTETINATQTINQIYRKSLRLTSKQIENLNLCEGANKVVFSVTTQYQGTCRCEAAIYLWNWDDRVIISDIDGTITKSDALGHILPQFGKDWTHKGIAKLYHKIHQNGYKFLYCSARAIGMAAITKGYLQWVNDQGIILPKGPVLLAPSSLFSALHREVIEKKPEIFKIACLSDIRDLFNPHRQPFYAAFGNRTNDAYAYKQVGVSEARIFTVNPKGELTQEMTKGNKSSYHHLSEMVEHFFPMLLIDGSTSSVLDCPEYSSFSYWKEPLPDVDLDNLL
ncbi:phosphatidate phosphatase LPIN2 [Nematolebias whitei]|uniref:phosphatidate phosphatase LPIN2 n=1 Tax=Nematolebias whitei TaxID=451745 RepID=UPI00189A008F|nr:phosphatidate phosphatase LPIN2 [Nematolebias whitei]